MQEARRLKKPISIIAEIALLRFKLTWITYFAVIENTIKYYPSFKPKTLVQFACFIACFLFLSCSDEPPKNHLDLAKIQREVNSKKFEHLNVQASTKTLFQLLDSSETGLDFNNRVEENYEDHFWSFSYKAIGGGLAIADFDNDGLPDLYFTGTQSPDKIYKNQGKLKFLDKTAESGIELAEQHRWSTGVTVVDFNQDGLVDIYVCKATGDSPEENRNVLYQNLGDFTFTEVAADYGLDDNSHSTQANFFDYDLDGDLDMYLLTYPGLFRDNNKFTAHKALDKGTNQSDKFYKNLFTETGKLSYKEVSNEIGINNHAYGLSATVADFNNDNWPDLLVCNDWAYFNQMFLNQKNGSFKEVSESALNKDTYYGMGADFGDINNDGLSDFFVADLKPSDNYHLKTQLSTESANSKERFETMIRSGYHAQYSKNSFQLNNGDGSYSEISNLSGTDATDWSWAPLFADFDNDGWKDLFISNGFYFMLHLDERTHYRRLKQAFRKDDRELYTQWRKEIAGTPYKFPNAIFKNKGQLQFEDMRLEWGLNNIEQSYGAAIGDLDLDGDIDIVVNNTNAPASIYKNNLDVISLENKSLQLSLQKENELPFDGFAKAYLFTSNGMQLEEQRRVKGFMSCSDAKLHFGLGADAKIDSLILVWEGGDSEVYYNNLGVQNRIVKKGSGNRLKAGYSPMFGPVMFKEESKKRGLISQHKEEDFDDYKTEFLLPHSMSNFGPVLEVGDVNGDDLDDLVIGQGKGTPNELWIQNSDASFNKIQNPFSPSFEAAETSGLLLFDADNDGDNDLYISSGSNEYKAGNPVLQDRLYLNDGEGNFHWQKDALPNHRMPSIAAKAVDIDKDGDLDLFVGNQQVPEQFLEEIESQILINSGAQFTSNKISIKNAACISDALWTDIDQDGDSDLFITALWSSPKLYENQEGEFVDRSKKYGLDELKGWWCSITAADFDNDGDQDYILGNAGENTNLRPSKSEPIRIYTGDLDQSGTRDIVLTYMEKGKEFPLAVYDRMAEQFPRLEREFPFKAQYGLATIQEIFDPEELKSATLNEVNTFSHYYLETVSKSDLQVKKLSFESQISPIFSAVPYDFNQDGNLDLAIQGNYFHTDPSIDRWDAGTGNVLLGLGNGNFEAQPIYKRGFYNRNDARELKLIRLADGKKGLVSSANQAEIRLWVSTSLRD